MRERPRFYHEPARDNGAFSLLSKVNLIDEPANYIKDYLYEKIESKGLISRLNVDIRNVYCRCNGHINEDIAWEIADIALLNINSDKRNLKNYFDGFNISANEAMRICIVKYESMVKYGLNMEESKKMVRKYLTANSTGLISEETAKRKIEPIRVSWDVSFGI